MVPKQPLKPGEIRFRFPEAKAPPPPPKPPPLRPIHHGGAGSVWAPILLLSILGIISLFNSSSGGGDYGGPPYSSPTNAIYGNFRHRSLILPPKPALAGKYAAFIRHEHRKGSDAVVFTYERIQIRIVPSASQIPASDMAASVTYPRIHGQSEAVLAGRQHFPGSNDVLTEWLKSQKHPLANPEPASPFQEYQWLKSPLAAAEPASPAKEFLNTYDSIESIRVDPPVRDRGTKEAVQKPPPYIITGDLIVEFGPLVNRDQMMARLIAHHGELKVASIDIIDGSPRGPPLPHSFPTKGIRTIYVIGKVIKIDGPTQLDNSVMDASIIDLGPNSKQLNKYIAEANVWHEEVKPLISDHNVSDETLWSSNAEKGLVIKTVDAYPAYDPYSPGGRDPYRPPVEPYHPRVEPYHPPVEHPVMY